MRTYFTCFSSLKYVSNFLFGDSEIYNILLQTEEMFITYFSELRILKIGSHFHTVT